MQAGHMEISATFGPGIATNDGCSIEWTTKYQQVVIVQSVLRIRTGENYTRAIEAKVSDVLWFPKGPRRRQGEDILRANFQWLVHQQCHNRRRCRDKAFPRSAGPSRAAQRNQG